MPPSIRLHQTDQVGKAVDLAAGSTNANFETAGVTVAKKPITVAARILPLPTVRDRRNTPAIMGNACSFFKNLDCQWFSVDGATKASLCQPLSRVGRFMRFWLIKMRARRASSVVSSLLWWIWENKMAWRLKSTDMEKLIRIWFDLSWGIRCWGVFVLARAVFCGCTQGRGEIHLVYSIRCSEASWLRFCFMYEQK